MDVLRALGPKHIAQLHELYQQEWWTKGRTLEETKNCVAGSQVCIGLVDANDDLIGFARVLTDFTFKALIFDVIVRKDSQVGWARLCAHAVSLHPDSAALHPGYANLLGKHPGVAPDRGEHQEGQRRHPARGRGGRQRRAASAVSVTRSRRVSVHLPLRQCASDNVQGCVPGAADSVPAAA